MRFPGSCERISWQAKAPAPPRRKILANISRLLIALAFAAPLCAQTCAVDPPGFNIGAATFTGTVHVTGTCGTYSVSVPSQFTWLHIPSGKVSGIPGDEGVSFT